MKISQEETQSNNQNTEMGNQPSNKQPKQPRPKWLGIVGIVALIAVFLFMVFKPSDKKESTKDSTAETTEVSKKDKTKDSSKVYGPPAPESSTKESTTESTSEAEPEGPLVDMKPKIEEFFNVMYNYNTKDSTPKDRAEKLLALSDKDVVNQVMPDALNEEPNKNGAAPSLIAEYKVTDIKVVPDEGVRGGYFAEVKYTVSVNGNESKHIDSFSMETKGDKITNAQQRSAITD